MTATLDGTASWQHGLGSLLARLGQNAAGRRRSHLEDAEMVRDILSRIPNGRREIAALCTDLCASMRITLAEAKRLIERARLLDRENVHRAARVDELGPEHLTVIERTIAAAPEADRDNVERSLLNEAGKVDAAGMAKLGRRILLLLDQDGKPPKDLAEPKRELHYGSRADGSVAFRGHVDAEAGAMLEALLSPLTKPTSAEDSRDLAQRQGDAFVEILDLAAGSEDVPTEGGERPHVAITMSLNDLIERIGSASVGTGGYVDAASARRLACDCKVIPVVLGSDSDPLDFGRITRTIPVGLRRALILRDRGCAFPGCSRPPRQAHAHHVQHWADGGPTSLDNCVLLCGRHHRVIHHSEWDVEMVEGRPVFTAPYYLRR